MTMRARNSQLQHTKFTVSGSSLRTGTLAGVEYIIVPCVSKIGNRVEHPVNAPCPQYIPTDVLSTACDNRNGKPVVLNHPVNASGEYVSANSPAVLSSYQMGYVYNARMSGDNVTCELWLDPSRAKSIGSAAEDIISKLKKGDAIEVSEGNIVLYQPEEGTFQGKKYGAIWVAVWSDHIACLTDTPGACAISDGCGASVSLSNASQVTYTTSQSTSQQKGNIMSCKCAKCGGVIQSAPANATQTPQTPAIRPLPDTWGLQARNARLFGNQEDRVVDVLSSAKPEDNKRDMWDPWGIEAKQEQFHLEYAERMKTGQLPDTWGLRKRFPGKF